MKHTMASINDKVNDAYMVGRLKRLLYAKVISVIKETKDETEYWGLGLEMPNGVMRELWFIGEEGAPGEFEVNDV